MKILIVDNYDSFTYNLSHYVKSITNDVVVLRNDELSMEVIELFDKVIISPGPGLPKDTLNLNTIYERFYATKPILGVCLGMEGMAEFFGGSIENQYSVKHGVEELIHLEGSSKLFEGLPSDFKVGLYHSWKVSDTNFPEELIITARSISKVIMAIEHKSLPLYGVQFHPESIMTEYGKEMIANFIRL